MIITSKSNEKIKKLVHLKEKKGRKEQGAYLVEGIKMVKEALQENLDVQLVIGLQEEVDTLKFNGEKLYATREVLAYISDCETSQNIFAVVKISSYPFGVYSDKCVLLDRVRDPGNLGTIIRTSVAVGVKDIYLYDSVDAYSPKVVRASMSGIYNVRLHVINDEQIEILSKNLPFICADMDGENVFSSQKIEKFCLCMGNEGNGLSDRVKALSQKTLKIPMMDKIESLNVAISYAIIIYNLIFSK